MTVQSYDLDNGSTLVVDYPSQDDYSYFNSDIRDDNGDLFALVDTTDKKNFAFIAGDEDFYHSWMNGDLTAALIGTLDDEQSNLAALARDGKKISDATRRIMHNYFTGNVYRLIVIDAHGNHTYGDVHDDYGVPGDPSGITAIVDGNATDDAVETLGKYIIDYV